MHETQPFNSSNPKSNNLLNSLKLKYTTTKNSKLNRDHQEFLNAYASLHPNKYQCTDRYKKQSRSPLRKNQHFYETSKQNYLNYRKSIVDIACQETGRANILKERSNNFSLQRKQSFMALKKLADDKSLPKFRQYIKVEGPNCSPRRQSTTGYEERVPKKVLREEKETFKQCDSPIKLIYASSQNEQEIGALPLKISPKAKSKQIDHYYKLQRQKTTKTISNIENILASIRNTLNK